MIISFFHKNIFIWADFLRVSTFDNTFDLENFMNSQRIIFDSFYWDRQKFFKLSPNLYNLILSNTLPLLGDKTGYDPVYKSGYMNHSKLTQLESTWEECDDFLKTPQNYTEEICKYLSESITLKSAYLAVSKELIKDFDYKY